VELEEVAIIYDVLPLKAARRNANDNSKSFAVSGHQELNFQGLMYIRYAAPLYPAGTL